MDKDIKNRMLYWFVNKKLKGYNHFDFADCLCYVDPEIKYYTDLIEFDSDFREVERIINENINIYDENN
jgi:hypothetical protein